MKDNPNSTSSGSPLGVALFVLALLVAGCPPGEEGPTPCTNDCGDPTDADTATPDMGPDTPEMSCDPGTAGDSCEPCATGTHCPGDGTETPCADGTWDDDADAATPCVAWTDCEDGASEREPGTATTDRVCGMCDMSSYQDGDSCVEYTTCLAGEFVAIAGTETTDRTCDVCAVGTFSETENALACSAWGDCVPGEFESSPGDSTSDRVCSPCDADSYSTLTNELMCTTKTTCVADEYVADPGTSTTDRTCDACPAGTTSTGPNATVCDDPCSVILGIVCDDVGQGYLKASNSDAGDRFGAAVAISGDTLVVGAPWEDGATFIVDGDELNNSGLRNGAVYVFVRSGDTWVKQAYLKSVDVMENGRAFGSAVAIDGDTIVVGAPGADTVHPVTGVGHSDGGKAYVFTRANGVWTQEAILIASNPFLGDNFGASVAVSTDTIAVSAPEENSAAQGIDGDQTNNNGTGALSSGAVYIFERAATAWTQQAYIKASNSEGADKFGTALDLDGDTLAVASPFEDSAAAGVDGDEADNTMLSAGAVYVFTRAAGVWSQQAYLKSSHSDSNDEFGKSVALDGDTIAVGVYGDDSSATMVDGDASDNGGLNTGAAFVFARNAGVWSQQAFIKASESDPSDRLGARVALSGDRLFVTADLEDGAATGFGGDATDNTAANSGAGFLFIRMMGVWSEAGYFKATNTGSGDNYGGGADGLGTRAAMDGNTLIVGTYREDSDTDDVDGDATDNSANEAGAAYVYWVGP